LTDVVPHRRIAIAGLFVFGALLVAGLIWIDALAARWTTATVPPVTLQPLRLDFLKFASSGSVSGWVASSMLLIAAALAGCIFSVRRHRLDDYHGRYRIWLYVAAIAAMWSVDTTAHLHVVLASQLTQWTGWGPLGGAVWSLLMVGLLAAVAGIRLLIEVAESPVAMTSLVGAYALWSTALLAQFELVPGIDGLPAAIVVASCLLGGHVLLLTMQLCYARHVTRDADGHLPLPAGKDAYANSVRTASDSQSAKPEMHREHLARPRRPVRKTTRGTDGPHGGGRRADSGKAAKVVQPAEPAAPVEPSRGSPSRVVQWTDGSDGPDRSFDGDQAANRTQKRTKAERKRLRKQKLRQRRAA